MGCLKSTYMGMIDQASTNWPYGAFLAHKQEALDLVVMKVSQ